jgi:AraC-like DNA-binding protein
MFSRATGLTFTQYVQRARTEKAKELLADREQRVSEVAFASGFQSIPHFNRVFRRLTGIAPTTYRANLFKAVSRNVESYLGKKKSANA